MALTAMGQTVGMSTGSVWQDLFLTAWPPAIYTQSGPMQRSQTH